MMIMNEVVYGQDQVEHESSFEKASIKTCISATLCILFSLPSPSRAGVCALAQIKLLNWCFGRDVEVEDIFRQTDGRARVRDVDNAGDMTLYGRAGEQEVDLVVVVAC